MTLEPLSQIGLILLVLLSASGGRAAAQAPLQVHLEPEQTEWALGVPVEFTVTAENVSTAPIRMERFYLDPRFGELSLFISSDGSSFRVYGASEWGTVDVSSSQLTLQPAQKITGRPFSALVMRSDEDKPTDPARDFAFPAPGTYFVKATVATSLGLLTSNVVSVVIRKPMSNDAVVWEALKHDKKLARFLQKPKVENPRVEPIEADKLRQLLNSYPDSAQAASIRRALDEHAKLKALIEERIKANDASGPQR